MEEKTIKCTNYCGFSVTGTEEFCENMYNLHSHQSEGKDDVRWHESLFDNIFSFPGMMMVIVVSGAIVSVVNHTKFW